MEKFAIDLDKVLDDFEFNEDCAEQIASVTSPITNATLNVDRCGIESSSSNVTSVDGAKLIQDFEVLSFGGKHENKTNVIAESKSSLDKSIILPQNNYHKDDSVRKCTDSINHFHAENSTSDHKVTQKQCIYHQDPEPISITIYNNTSQTLLTKQQNSNNNQQLLQNRYDKKLNQPNIKPTVSNVFNSLNEYINAPTISLDYVDSMLDKQQEIRPKKQTDTITEDKIVSNINTEITDHNVTKITTDKNKIVEEVHNDVEASVVLSLNQDVIENKNQFVNTDTSQVPKSHVESSQEDLKSVHMEYKSEQADEDIDSDKKKPIVQPYKENIQYEHVRVFEDKKINDSASESVLSELDDACKLTDELYTNIIVKTEAINISNEITLEKIKESHDIDMNTLPSNSHQSKNLVHSAQKPVGFNNINDDLSEEELNKYLETLEIEENLTEGAVHPQNALLSEGYKNTIENNTSNNTFSYKESKDDKQIHLATNKIDNSQIVEKEIKATMEKCSERSSTNKHDQDMMKDKVSDNILHDDRYSMKKSNNFTTIIPVNKEGQIQTQSDNNVIVKNLENPVDNVEYVKDTEIKNQPANETQSWSSSEDKHIIRVENNESEQSEEIVQPAQSNACTIQNNKDVISSSEQNNNQISELQILGNTSYDTKDKSHKLQGNKTLNDIVNICTDIQPKSTDVCIENNTENNENTEGGSKAVRPQTLDIASTVSMNDHPVTDSPSNASKQQGTSENEGNNGNNSRETAADLTENALTESIKILGKQPPFWIPDSDASSCMLCDLKFTVLKRRHHCRACGKVLCNKCCNMKYRLEYQGNIYSRVCVACYQLLMKAENQHETSNWPTNCVNYGNNSDVNSPQGRPPNPNNPMEYCSTIPPLQQLAGGLPPPPPTVMVPVGVLKREGSTKQRSEGSKSVMFSDGIRPGCDLTELDSSWDLKPPYRKTGSKRVSASDTSSMSSGSKKQNLLPLDPNTNSYIPQDPNLLPPTVTIHKGQISYHNVTDQDLLYKTLKNECEPPVMFAINKNLYAYVKITNLSCCVNRICWNVTSKGLACVGQDEIILLLETLPDETQIPKDLLMYINHIYIEATKGNTMTELSVSIHQGGNLLGSREHAGFLFIRQTLQCLQKIVLPPAPFLVGLLIHRWETPWAKVFPLRLVLRLGAEYRYYPCPLVSVRFRDALYFEIGHTVMKVLADFRNFGYTLPGVRGLTIHLKNRTTDVMFPRNRYDQVIKGLNNSNDHVLAFASNFSITADSHLVCIQTNTGDESSYQTQAINIQNKPRTVTGASFIVINGALKSSMGLSAKSSIVEDGLMVEIMPEKMEALKAALKNMHDFSIGCGRQGAAEPDETVNIKWVENDVQFNLGVKSPIDGQLMDGVPSIRVHNATDYRGTSRFIRWTEVFIIKSDDHPNGVHDPMDINKLSESIARATCAALVKLLDLLATAGLTKIGVRTTIHPDNVGYEAGSEGAKLPPIYMNSLDNELIQILHKAAQSSQDTHTVLELIFYVLDE
ncbi:PREDICTED: zinc finger FYVE domain-containing protein 9 isoform X1 [Polistes canadensis]|uniref:zinc finger FYVE domain-containing protein 9 isoform X1 n=1 Tax=Polistes canadensis TaxID=91411 RepID=UPI000718D344|nr:PREDICTED: zinc finger FYVE domain-containing protein 9 isoform X1 [Polistes canadensis]XP_014616567.1 PREDICTED: zinc finger FYVE domain-containing protein 9 isoform X1 [Polistes canadensis]